MKAILMSIQPKWVEKILNGEKTIEIRKRFPKDYVGWVYIYCTKDNNNLLHKNCADIWWVEDSYLKKQNEWLGVPQQPNYNGKVVARFWCDEVEEINCCGECCANFSTEQLTEDELVEKSWLSYNKLFNYFSPNASYDGYSGTVGDAIYISKVEIFNKPKDITTFFKWDGYEYLCKLWDNYGIPDKKDYEEATLKKAPQSWCYVEGDYRNER